VRIKCRFKSARFSRIQRSQRNPKSRSESSSLFMEHFFGFEHAHPAWTSGSTSGHRFDPRYSRHIAMQGRTRFRKLPATPGRMFSQTLKRLATWRYLRYSQVSLLYRFSNMSRHRCYCIRNITAKVAQPIQSGSPWFVRLPRSPRERFSRSTAREFNLVARLRAQRALLAASEPRFSSYQNSSTSAEASRKLRVIQIYSRDKSPADP